MATTTATKPHLCAGGVENSPRVAASTADDLFVELEALFRYYILTEVEMTPMFPGSLYLLGTLHCTLGQVPRGGFIECMHIQRRLAFQCKWVLHRL
jgi:hypothetical protein